MCVSLVTSHYRSVGYCIVLCVVSALNSQGLYFHFKVQAFTIFSGSRVEIIFRLFLRGKKNEKEKKSKYSNFSKKYCFCFYKVCSYLCFCFIKCTLICLVNRSVIHITFTVQSLFYCKLHHASVAVVTDCHYVVFWVLVGLVLS